MKKNKGFTLIELIAVIVILSAIALITIPIALNIIDTSRKGAFEKTAHGVLKAIDYYYANNPSIEEDITFTIEDGKYVGEELPTSTSLPEDGVVHLSKEGKTSFALHQGNWCAIKTEEVREINVIDYDEKTCVLPQNITLLIDKLLIDAGETLIDYSQTYGELSQNSVYGEKYVQLIANNDLNEKIDDKSYFENKKFYVGENPNNYIYFNGKKYRIVSIDSQGVKVMGLYNPETDSKALSSSNPLLVNQGAKFLVQAEFITADDEGFDYRYSTLAVDTFINNLSDRYVDKQTGEYYEKEYDSDFLVLVPVLDYYYTNKLEHELNTLVSGSTTFSSWMSEYAPFTMNGIVDYYASGLLGFIYLTKTGEISSCDGASRGYDNLITPGECNIKTRFIIQNPIYVEYYISPTTVYLSGDGSYENPYQYVNEVVVDGSNYIYESGEAITFDPISNNGCSIPTSNTGTKAGCMKWHVLEDDGDNLKVILDHNTTVSAPDPYTQIISDTQEWDASIEPRLPSAEEIANITGYYFIKEKKNSIYVEDWLYNRTSGCMAYGCEVEDSSTRGYWTNEAFEQYYSYRWGVSASGLLYPYYTSADFGIRPVITISKSRLLH